MNELRTTFNAAIMFITHDLGVIAHMADDVVVMYLGRIVESASVKNIFYDPKHPYTKGLINSIPSLVATKEKQLIPIEGSVPELLDVGQGCGFESRCPHSMDICMKKNPPLVDATPGHRVACWLISNETRASA